MKRFMRRMSCFAFLVVLLREISPFFSLAKSIKEYFYRFYEITNIFKNI